MTSMVEKVAQAIYEHWRAGSEWAAMSPWEDLPSNHISRTNALGAARAVIEAMREPTGAMMEAMDEHAGTIAPQYANEAAIDAALLSGQ